MELTKNSGFTLVELMIAVAIIAILAAIAVPSFLGIQKKSTRSEAKSNLMALSLALEGNMAENNDYGPTGVYTHYAPANALDSFAGYPTSLAIIANIGNNNHYQYSVGVSTAPPSPVFSIRAIPMRGRVLGDLSPTLDQNGQKGPVDFGW